MLLWAAAAVAAAAVYVSQPTSLDYGPFLVSHELRTGTCRGHKVGESGKGASEGLGQECAHTHTHTHILTHTHTYSHTHTLRHTTPHTHTHNCWTFAAEDDEDDGAGDSYDPAANLHLENDAQIKAFNDARLHTSIELAE